MKTIDYWESIPIGRRNRLTYRELIAAWGINERAVRHVLHRLSEYDNGDGTVLIRSSKPGGVLPDRRPRGDRGVPPRGDEQGYKDVRAAPEDRPRAGRERRADDHPVLTEC